MSKKSKKSGKKAAHYDLPAPQPFALAEVQRSTPAPPASGGAIAGHMPFAHTYTGAGDQPKGGAVITGDVPPEMGEKPSLVQFGSPGVAIMSGIIQSEEYNPDLFWKEAIRVYDKMRRSDPMVQQILSIQEMPIRAATAKVVPASPDPDHLEHAAFIETCLFHDLEGQDWDSLLRQCLLMLPYGFMLFEKVFKYQDGKAKWQYFSPMLPKTVHRWWEGPDKQLLAIQQWTFNPLTQNYEYVNIRSDKVLRFTHRQEGNNYEGLSVLRTAYKHWWFKQAFEKLMSVGFEREHVGIPVISLPEGYTDADTKRAAQIGRNARSNELGYIVLPPGWAAEWLKSKGTERKSTSILDAIRYFDLQMQNSVLAGFLNLGQSGTGSYAMSSDQSAIFLKSLQGLASYIGSVFSLDAFPQLIKFNYGAQDLYPRLIFQNLQAYDLKTIADAMSKLVNVGAIRPSLEIEDWLYQLFGAPRTPSNLVESTLDGFGPGRLKPDMTGVTPLPLTPEEQIAVANRMTRDLQRVTVSKDGGDPANPNGPNNTPAVKLPSHITGRAEDSKPGRGTPAPSGDAGSLVERMERQVNDAYLTPAYRLMEPTQQVIYLRMAGEAGRPAIHLTGDYEFASHPAAVTLAEPRSMSIAQADRLRRRRDLTGDLADEMRGNFDTLRQELLAAVSDTKQELTERVNELESDYGNTD